mmetsp:Transcript_66564/g.187465  ORF Transcript_66564/g.187465 Transcript_66564/m.187465 type:complete len:221 (+) Transcript_66564:1833-2495(+)
MSTSNAMSTGSFSCWKLRFFRSVLPSVPPISEVASMTSLPGFTTTLQIIQGSCSTMSSPSFSHKSPHASSSLQVALTSYLTTRSSGIARASPPPGHARTVTGSGRGAKNSLHAAASFSDRLCSVCSPSMIGTKKLSQNPHSPLNCFDSGVSSVTCRMRMTKNLSRPTFASAIVSSSHFRLTSDPLRKRAISSQCSCGDAKAQTSLRPKCTSRMLGSLELL